MKFSRKHLNYIILCLFFNGVFWGIIPTIDEENSGNQTQIENSPQPYPVIYPPFQNSPLEYSPQTQEIGQKVMLQGYFWEVIDDGTWWNIVRNEVPLLGTAGFDSFWLPPFTKTNDGGIARCGYEPYDYYDLGEFFQQGSIETRYGSRLELEALIDEMHQYGISAIGDVVINHNNGGELEENPFVGKSTETNFMNVASGLFPRNYSHFHPNDIEESDPGVWGTYPDLCHHHPYVQEELYKWGQWLQDEIGFDGWRFDMLIGIYPDVIRDWMNNLTNSWAVGEYWTGHEFNIQDQLDYLDGTNNTITTFDFPLMYELRNMAFGNGTYDMQNLVEAGILGFRPDQAVTFVVNHDTGLRFGADIPIDWHPKAYAYILTHEGYPMVYWDDFYDILQHKEIKTLVEIHNQFAKGNTEILFADEDVYVMQRDGDPGLLYIMNDDPINSRTVTVPTKWADVTISDLMDRMPKVEVDSTGDATITAPASGYTIYSTGSPLISLHPPMNESTILQTIPLDVIQIDGILEDAWPSVKYVDRKGDAGVGPLDLHELLLTTDEKYLYIGFTTGKFGWNGDNLHYGIAIDTKSGGIRSDPGLHPNVTWAGSGLPDYIYYLETDNDESKYHISTGMQYILNEDDDEEGEEWQTNRTLSAGVDFASNLAMKFVEIKIPLAELELEQGGEFGLKIFSTEAGRIGAADTLPFDEEVDAVGDSQSWLSLLVKYEIPPIISTDALDSSIMGYQVSSMVLFVSLACVVIIWKIRQKRF